VQISILRHGLNLPAISVAVTPALGVAALSYRNGCSVITATVVATATTAVGLWAAATEP